MAEAFDAYRVWLGIPPSEQPPDHYRLLGVARFESDPDVIANAADRQMTHVRRYQSGKHSELSQRILNELSAARVCLLDAQRRGQYDRQLRDRLAVARPVAQAAPAAPPPPPPGNSEAPPVAAGPTIPTMTPGARAAPTPAAAARRYAVRRKRSSSWPVIAAVAGLFAAVGLVLLLVVLNSAANSTSGEKDNGQTSKSQAPTGKSPGSGPPAAPGKKPKEEAPGITIQPPKPKVPDVAETKPKPPARPTPPDPIKVEPGFVGLIRPIEAHTGRVSAVAFSPTYPFIVSAGVDGVVHRWRAAEGDLLSTYDGAKAPIRAVTFSSDGLQVVAAGDPAGGEVGGEGLVYFWEVGGNPLPLLNLRIPDSGTVHAMAVSRDGKLLALGSDDEVVRLVEPGKPGQKQLRQFPEADPETYERDRHHGPVLSVDFSPDAALILSGGTDGKAFVWETATARRIAQFTGHRGPVHCVVCLPDGQRALSGSEDKSLCLWDLKTGKLIQRLTGHTAAVTSLAVSPDGARALSGSVDGTMRLWDLASRQTIRAFAEDQGPVRCVAISPGGLDAVSGADDGTIRLWKLPAPDEDTEPGSKPEVRAAPPSAEAVQAARDRIRNELFKDDFAKPDKKALAQKLLSEGSVMGRQADLAYAMIVMSAELAAEVGDLDAAFMAVDRLCELFEADGLHLRIVALRRAAEAPSNGGSGRTAGARFLEVLDAIAERDRFEHLDAMAMIRPKLVSRRTDAELNKLVVARLSEVAELKAEFAKVGPAQQTLREDPDDPQANQTVGRYTCLIKGDWAQGLPMLARSADSVLAAAAQADLAGPADAQAQLAVADRWWAVAEHEAGKARGPIRLRAAHWYQKAEPALPDADRAKARRRIDEASASGGAAGGLGPPSAEDLQCRENPLRQTFLEYYGGNAATEVAVDRALKWLADHQQSDGSWSFNHEAVEQAEKSGNPGTLTDAAIGPTAVALLPFLGANHTPRQGVHRDVVRGGIGVLLTRINATGNLIEPDAPQFPSHPLGTIALCEVSTLYRDKATRTAAHQAVRFALLVQNQDGGWPLRVDIGKQKPEASDLPATGWYVAALRAAQRAGISVPAETTRQARQFIESCRSDDGAGFLAQPGGGDPEPLATAVGFHALMLLGAERDLDGLADYAAQLEKDGPSTRGEFLFNYVAGNLLRDYGGDPWQSWNPAIRDRLLASQGTTGAASGSWYQAGGEWGNRQGGRLLSTALAALTLEVYYRHPPLYPTP